MNLVKMILCLLILTVPNVGHSSNSLFKSQEELNTAVAKIAHKTYGQINQNWNYPSLGEPIKMDSEHWEAGTAGQENGGQIYAIRMLKNELTPSACLDELLQSKSLLECTIARSILRLSCMRALLGESSFNIICDVFRDTTDGLVMGSNNPGHDPSMGYLETQSESIFHKPVVGRFGYVINCKEYPQLHPLGQWIGSNLAVIEEEGGSLKYMGFGESYGTDGLTREEVKADLRKEMLGKEPSHSELHSSYDQSFEGAQEGQVSYSFHLEAVNKILGMLCSSV